MKFLWRYLRIHVKRIVGVMGIKLSGTLMELLIPYVMEHLIDHVVPAGNVWHVLLWGLAMLCLAGAGSLIQRDCQSFFRKNSA